MSENMCCYLGTTWDLNMYNLIPEPKLFPSTLGYSMISGESIFADFAEFSRIYDSCHLSSCEVPVNMVRFYLQMAAHSLHIPRELGLVS
jgi:hypothetical protein